MATMELRQKKPENNPHTPLNRMGTKSQDTTLKMKKVNAATNTLSTHAHDVSVQACIKPNQKDACIEACTYQWKLSTDKHIQTSVTYAKNADMQTQTDEPNNTRELGMQTMCTNMNVVEAAMQTRCTSMNVVEAAMQTRCTSMNVVEAAMQTRCTSMNVVEAAMQTRCTSMNVVEAAMQTRCTSMNVVEAAMQTRCTSMNVVEAATQTEPTNSKTQNTHTQTDKDLCKRKQL